MNARAQARRDDMQERLRMLISVMVLLLTGHTALGRIQAGDIRQGQTFGQGLVDDQSDQACRPSSLETTDYLLDVISTLPSYQGQPAQLQIHRVRPVYEHRRC